MIEFLAANWVIFLIATVILYIVTFILGAMGMKKFGTTATKAFDGFAQSGSAGFFSNFFGSWFKAQFPAVVCGILASVSGILFLIGVIVNIIQIVNAG